MDLNDLRAVTSVLALVACAMWTALSVYRWPVLDEPDKALCLSIGVLLLCLCLAFGIKAATGPGWAPVVLLTASLAGVCAALAYRLRHKPGAIPSR